MLLGYFSKELEKIANPNVIKYLNSYNPTAARIAVQREFGMLHGALKNESIDEETKLSIRKRLDDLNRADYLVDKYEKSLKRRGQEESPKSHLRKGLEDGIEESTGSLRRRLSQLVMQGKISKQDSLIVAKKRAKDAVPEGLNERYVEEFEGFMGANPESVVHQEKEHENMLLGGVRPDFPDGVPRQVIEPEDLDVEEASDDTV